MTTDPDRPQVPARRLPDETQISPDVEIRDFIGYLPKTSTVETDEKISIALDEGYDPMAIELALNPQTSSPADKLRILILIIAAAVLVLLLFPLNRFFKPAPQDLGPMSIGGPVLEDSLAKANSRNQPWLKVLVKIDQLYFREGRLNQAIQVAEGALEKVPQDEWEIWHKVYYRYWELLFDAGRIQKLIAATRKYLAAFPEDPFATYYYARAFLSAADRNRSYTSETKSAYRQEAETVAQQIGQTCSALEAQTKHPEAEKDKMVVLMDLYRKLRLEQAKMYVLIWKLGGYEEDEHPDVIYRDKALDICASEALSDMNEAKELKAVIYTHILDRWHWLEGQQIIQGRKQKRKALQQQLDNLNQALEEAEKL
jgi:hypothetical protein